MNLFKKIWACEKAQLQKSETLMVAGIVGGVLIGIGTDNIGLGIALGVVFGVSAYASSKKKKKEDVTDGRYPKIKTHSTVKIGNMYLLENNH